MMLVDVVVLPLASAMSTWRLAVVSLHDRAVRKVWRRDGRGVLGVIVLLCGRLWLLMLMLLIRVSFEGFAGRARFSDLLCATSLAGSSLGAPLNPSREPVSSCLTLEPAMVLISSIAEPLTSRLSSDGCFS